MEYDSAALNNMTVFILIESIALSALRCVLEGLESCIGCEAADREGRIIYDLHLRQ